MESPDSPENSPAPKPGGLFRQIITAPWNWSRILWEALVDFLFRNWRRALEVLLALGLVGAGLRMANLDVLWWLPRLPRTTTLAWAGRLPGWAAGAGWISDLGADWTLVAEARRRGEAYVITSAVQYLDYEPGPDGQGIHVSERIMYDLLLLRDVKSDENVFEETYGSTSRPPTRWYGAQGERREAGVEHKYFVDVHGRRGERKSIVTGAEIDYPATEARLGPDGKPLSAEDDWWEFSTDIPVGCLVQLVESRALEVRGLRLSQDGRGDGELGVMSSSQQGPDAGANSAVSATWTLVRPNQRVFLFFEMKGLLHPR